MLILNNISPQCNDHIEIDREPYACKNVTIRVDGRGNRLFVGKNVHLHNVTLDFRGDDNTISIEDHVLLRGGVLVHEGSSVRIGAGTKFHWNAVLEAREGTSIDIGRNCLMSQVRLTTSDVHSVFDLDTRQRINKSRDIKLHDHVWLAFDALVSKGSEIGCDSIVGAKALVAGRFPSNCVIAGNPGKVIREGVTWDHRSLEEIPPDSATVMPR